VHWSSLLAVPAFLVLALNGAWIAVMAGIVATRFRDIPPIIASLTQLLFFMTPIVWSYERLSSNPLAAYIELNPVLHFVEILREPLLGQEIVARHWIVVGVITVVGCGAALVCLRNYRARVAYWV
jgi:ABC-2 type transport system permease protein